MSQQDNVRLVQDALDAWNKHDPERFVALLDDKHVIESDTLPAPMTGREAADSSCRSMSTRFPICVSTTNRSSEAVTSLSHAGPRPERIVVI